MTQHMKASFHRRESCAPAWAAQQHASGHCRNLSFQGRMIYSDAGQFPLAYIHGDYAFITLRTNSNLTAKYLRTVTGAAIQAEKQLIYVRHLPGMRGTRIDFYSKENLEEWILEIRNMIREFSLQPRRVSLLDSIRLTYARIGLFIAALDLEPDASLLQLMNDTDFGRYRNHFLGKSKIQQLKSDSMHEERTANGIGYTWAPAGTSVRSFILYPGKAHTARQIKVAEKEIRKHHHVHTIRLANAFDLDDRYIDQILQHPQVIKLTRYEIDINHAKVRAARLAGISIDDYVAAFVLPMREKTKNEWVKKHGPGILNL